MIDDIKQDAESRMTKTLHTLKGGLSKIRTGRAQTSLLDHIKVDHYGNSTPLNQLASLSVSDGRTISISPWEKTMVAAIEKAILTSDLGLNPNTAGTVIRIVIPALTEERRRELGKIVGNEGEQGKIAIRNIRRDANNHVKELLKEKEISEDEERQAEAAIQLITDKYVAQVDVMVESKEKELMEF